MPFYYFRDPSTIFCSIFVNALIFSTTTFSTTFQRLFVFHLCSFWLFSYFFRFFEHFYCYYFTLLSLSHFITHFHCLSMSPLHLITLRNLAENLFNSLTTHCNLWLQILSCHICCKCAYKSSKKTQCCNKRVVELVV